MKSKIFAIIAVLILALSIFTGCGGNDESSDTASDTHTTDGALG